MAVAAGATDDSWLAISAEEVSHCKRNPAGGAFFAPPAPSLHSARDASGFLLFPSYFIAFTQRLADCGTPFCLLVDGDIVFARRPHSTFSWPMAAAAEAERRREETVARAGRAVQPTTSMYLPPLCFDAATGSTDQALSNGATSGRGTWAASAVTTRALFVDKEALQALLPLELPATGPALAASSLCRPRRVAKDAGVPLPLWVDKSERRWRSNSSASGTPSPQPCECATTMEELLTYVALRQPAHAGCVRFTRQAPSQFYVVHPPDDEAQLRSVYGAALGLEPGSSLEVNPTTGRRFARHRFDDGNGLYALGLERLLQFTAGGGFGCCDAEDGEVMSGPDWTRELLAWNRRGRTEAVLSEASPIACRSASRGDKYK